MTVYVDNARISARVGITRARWSHLVADTKEELHEFAERIGLKREWFQAHCKVEEESNCPHWHYGIVDSKRNLALIYGAQPIDMRQMSELLQKRRAEIRGNQ